MSNAAEVKNQLLRQLARALEGLPEIEKKMSKREMVALMAGEIAKARGKGYSLRAIADQLQKNGFDISHASLRVILPTQRKPCVKPVGKKIGKKKRPFSTPDQPGALTPNNQAPQNADSLSLLKNKPAALPKPVFPPGAAYIPLPGGRFLPAPDSEDL